MERLVSPAQPASELDVQERLLPFLLDPHSYPHRPRRVRLVQTHSSFVLLAPPFVYKVKKPVNFGFLDYSTLEKRRYFCEREVALNRRLSPRMYLGVVPIARADDSYTFGEGDTIVEYAVKMRKLPERGFLDRLVAEGAVNATDLDRVVATLREFYQAQHPTAEIEAWGRIDRLRISTDENFRQTEPFIGRTLSRAVFAATRVYTNAFYAAHRDLFASRIRERWIRDCHGDLHLEHIHLTPHALHIYDCIEFNDRLRYVDVANDAAFLAMDLDFNGRPDLARHFIERMARALGDAGMRRLIDFYKCYRAYVRGKVESLHSVAPAAPDAERHSSAERARRYFRLALQYAVAGSQPLVFVVIGGIASGKSTLARALAAELDWPVFSSDQVRKEMAGFPLHERSPEAARARLYTSAMTKRVYARLLAAAGELAARGRGAILDATFGRRTHRERLTGYLTRRHAAYHFLEAQADAAAVKQRLEERALEPGEISDARLEDFEQLSRLYEPPAEVPAAHRTAVPTTLPPAQTLGSVLQALARLRARSASP